MRGRSAVAHLHRLLHQFVRCLGKERVRRLAVDRLAGDLEYHRNGERRDVIERLMDDSPLDAREHIGEAAHV
jgi:hypothetical protein